jgi:hypothetical protein
VLPPAPEKPPPPNPTGVDQFTPSVDQTTYRSDGAADATGRSGSPVDIEELMAPEDAS